MKLSIAISTLCLLMVIHQGQSECCKPHLSNDLNLVCGDCRRIPAFTCCGYGRCNIFCCNCDPKNIDGQIKVCKTGNCWRSAILDLLNGVRSDRSVSPANDILRNFDANQDQRIDWVEFKAKIELHRARARRSTVEAEFEAMDTNGDGFITLQEIDRDAE